MTIQEDASCNGKRDIGVDRWKGDAADAEALNDRCHNFTAMADEGPGSLPKN